MAAGLGEGVHGLSPKPGKGKGGGKLATGSVQVSISIAVATPAANPVGHDHIAAEVQRTKQNPQHIIDVQAKLDAIPRKLVETEKELNLEL